MTRTITLIAALLVLTALPAAGQSPAMPYTYPAAVGTSSAQVIAVNPMRKRVEFYNASDTAKIAVCPLVSRKDSTLITCTVNGPGSITLLPYQSHRLDGVGQNAAVNSGWNAVASSGGAGLTIMEWE